MPNDIMIMEAANLFCGDVDPTNSQHLTLREIKLPELNEQYVDHSPGGAPITIEVDTIFAKLEANFTLAGWSPEVVAVVSTWSQAQRVFTAYGVIRDRRTGNPLEAKAVMGGRLGRANPAQWRRGDLQHWEYSIKGITHYELYFDESELVYWDFFENALRIDSEPRNDVINSILRIPVVA
jgi:phage tail tube protein FII